MGHPFHRFIHSYVHQGRIGVLVEFGLEADFATRTQSSCGWPTMWPCTLQE
jgi:elongation factor Ts